MKTFKKGTKVRIVSPEEPEYDGLTGTVDDGDMTSSTGEKFAYVMFDNGDEDTVPYGKLQPMKENKMKKHKINENFSDKEKQKEYEEAFRYAMNLSQQEIYELIRDKEHDEFYDNSDSWMSEIGRPESEMENYFDDLTSEIEEVLYGQDAEFTAYCDARDNKEKAEKISTESRKMKIKESADAVTLKEIDEMYGTEVKDALLEYCDKKDKTPDEVVNDLRTDKNGMTAWDKFDVWCKATKKLDVMGKMSQYDDEMSKELDRKVKKDRGLSEYSMDMDGAVEECDKAKELPITKEQFNKSNYFQKKYGKLEYVSESGKMFKTSKGQVLKFSK